MEKLIEEARRLDENARFLKRVISKNRKTLQEVRTRQAEIEDKCMKAGIQIEHVRQKIQKGI